MSKKNKEMFKALISWIIIIIVVYLLIKVNSAPIGSPTKADNVNCPSKIEGNQNASLVIKYIESPYCVWCWFEEPILKRAIATKGNLFRLERYDIRYCEDIVTKYRFSGTPSFVFSLKNDSKEFTHTGFISEEELNRIICSMSGGCVE